MEQETQKHNLTDVGNADRFLKIYGNKVRYLKDKKTFLLFDEVTGWTEAPERFNLTRAVISDIHLEAAECKEDSYRVDLATHARHTESTTAQRNFLALVEDYAAVRLKDFDANTKSINCRNGVVS